MSEETQERADDHEWLSWFYAHADFGPAHEDVVMELKRQFIRESGKRLPHGYEEPTDD
jgi:hypothetical protein